MRRLQTWPGRVWITAACCMWLTSGLGCGDTTNSVSRGSRTATGSGAKPSSPTLLHTAGSNAPLLGASAGRLASPAAAQSCAGTNVQAGRKQPLVMLVIDGSGSMCAPFGGSTRWTALRSALMDADGVVTKLQAAVSFGMTLFDGPIDLSGLLAGGGMFMGGSSAQNPQCAAMGLKNAMGKACPNLIEVPQALNNAQAIAAMYPMMELGGSTPTHKTLASVVDKLIASQVAVPDHVLQPQYIVLATDGEPNELCPNPSGAEPHMAVIEQVTRAAQAGIKTFVISLAGDDANLMSHLAQVAQAGMTGYMPFSPMSKQDLVASLGQIIGGAVGCEVFLNGKVATGQECGGTVEVNGSKLPCNDPNGWSLKDDHTLMLKGQACQAFQNDPLSVLHADFPCGVFIPS